MSMKPVVNRLANEYRGLVDFLFLNIDEPQNRDAMKKYGFVGQPQFVIVNTKDEVVVSRNGVQTYERLKADIEAVLSGSP